MARIEVIAHVIRVDLATGEIRIPRMCGLSRRRRNKNITISVGPVTHVDEEWIGSVIRQFLGREGGRHLVLASVGAPEVIPVRQRPGRGASEANDVLTQLRLERHQIAAVPRKEKPALMLALIPIEILVATDGKRRRGNGGRRLDELPTGKRRLDVCWGDVFAVDGGVKPPTGGIVEGPAHHFADAFRVPEEIGVSEVAAFVPSIVTRVSGSHSFACLSLEVYPRGAASRSASPF